MKRTIVLTGLALLTSAASSLLAGSDDARSTVYQVIEVMRFNSGPGVDFPPDYLATMMEELVAQLTETGKFQQVLRQGETPAQANTPTIRLIGTVTDFNKGSRAMRYVVGFGAGKTKVKAHVKFIDSSTGDVRLEKNVDGAVWIGFIGGESIGATRGLAKEVAKLAASRL